MAGPWEQYQQQAVPAGPWEMFGGRSTVPPGVRTAESLRDAVIAGLESSATGLAINRKLPTTAVGPDSPWHHRLAANAAGIVLDLPLSIAAAVPAGIAGTAVGPAGSVVAGGAAAFAAPMALREALMTAYSQNHARDWNDVWEIAKSAMSGGAKGALIGGATLGAGRAVAPLVAGAGVAARVGVPLTAELGTLTTTAAMVEGHLPTAQDFVDNAILLGGMKGAVHVAGRLRAAYAATGKHPAEIAGEARTNAALKAALLEEPGPVRPGEPPLTRLPDAFIGQSIQQRVDAALGADPRPEMVRSILDEAARKEPKGFDEIMTELAPVKMEYLITGNDLAAFSRTTEALFRNEIALQTRGEISAQQTVAEGIKKMSGLSPHEIGAAASPSEMAARAFTFRASSAEAMRVIREQALKPEAERTTADNLAVFAALERAQMAYQHLRGAAAETARSLNILWQLKYRPDLMPEAKALEAYLEKSLKGKKPGEKLTFQELASMAAALKDPAQLAAFAQKMAGATTLEMVIEGWKAAILSGPLTHMANLMGNIAKFFVEVPETALTTTITATRRALQGDAMSFPEYKAKALAPLYGLRWGARDSLVIAGEALKGRGEHLEKADIYRHAIPGKAGYVIRTPFRMLQAEDVLFRTTAEKGRAHEFAVERALKEGFKADTREFNERVAQYTLEPRLGLDAEAAAKRMAEIEAAGAEAVFAQRLGPMLERMQAAFANTPMQFILPFVRTPANLLSWAVQHSPGFLLSSRWRNEFAAGGASRDRAIARVLMGTALSITALALADEGLLTGGGHFDPEERRTKMAAGWQPYSIKIGDTYYSYQRLEPVGKVVGLIADLMEMSHETRDADAAKTFAASIALFGNATISTTYLSGLGAVFNAATEPARYAETFFEQYAASLIPKIAGQTAALSDPHMREVHGVVDAIQSQIPFLREKLVPQRDVWGEPRKAEKLFGVLPVAITTEAKDKVKSEALRLELAISDIPKQMFESGPTKASERKIEYTTEQRDRAREVSGKWAMSILAPIVNSPDWSAIPDFAKAEVYREITTDARALGREAAIPATSEAREALRKKIVDKIEEQIKAVEGKNPSTP